MLLPPTAVPQSPTLLGAFGGDRTVTVSFLAVEDASVTSYRVYRADSVGAADDIRLMQVVATVTDNRSADQRTTPLSEPDTSVVPYTQYYYRVTAVITGNGDSPESAVATAKAFDGAAPPEPTWERAEWIKLDSSGGEHQFTEQDPSLTPALAVRLAFSSASVAQAALEVVNGSFASQVSPWLDPLPGEGAGMTRFATYLRSLSPTRQQVLLAQATNKGGTSATSTTHSVSPP